MSSVRLRASTGPGATNQPATAQDTDGVVRDSAPSDSKSPPVTRKAPKPTRLPLLLALSALLATALFLVSRNSRKDVLPPSFALCSREGNIYTVDEKQPKVECVVVHGGRIADVGSISEVRKRWGDRDLTGPVSDAPRASAKEGLEFIFIKRGSIIVPGLADAHGHVLEYGLKRQLELDGSNSVEEIIRRVSSYIHARPELINDTSKWVQGFGWDQNRWEFSEFPTADELDKDPLLQGRPIALTRVDGHAVWVSPTVLKLMDPIPKSVEGGLIVRDGNGTPTGIFVDNAMALIPRPKWTNETMKHFFGATMKDALTHGLTSIHDAGSEPEHIQFFKKMADERMLPIRLYVMGHVSSNEYWGSQIPRLQDYGGGRLTVRSVKLISDGALGSWGAAMLQPYTDKLSSRGLLLTPPNVLSSLIHQFFKDDWQVNVHCIGDRANKIVLDIFESALKGRNSTIVRPRIEHAQIMTLSDLNRTGHLGVIPSVQPTHATSDMSYAEQRVGPERIKGAYAYLTLLQNSKEGIMPLGSDFPIESIDPWRGFYAAVTRLSTEGTSPHGSGGWFPSQRLTRVQALKGMTLDPAYASFAETEIGSIERGKRADFAVLDADVMSVPVDQILKAKVTATILDGVLVFGRLV